MHDMSAFAWVGIGVGFHQGGKKKKEKEKTTKEECTDQYRYSGIAFFL